jgi:NAD(P)-dependent dehydrogenase (short-subunit alcohol dehydrogenase family)
MTDKKIVLLTGSTAGIGRAAAIALVNEGFYVVCAARDAAKAERLVDELGRDRASALIGDLSRPAEVARVAREFVEQHERLDVLFNNAGALFLERRITGDGLERTFALNHMSYFVMTVMLLDLLKASAPARVVSTSSHAHRQGGLDYLDDLQTERWEITGMRAYGRSKLANIWFTVELARRLEGTGVTANCFHPGFVASDFGRNNGILATIAMTLSRPLQKSVEQGADTGVWLATASEISGETGGYFYERKRRKGTPAARDAEAPARLWRESERIAESLLGEGWASRAG